MKSLRLFAGFAALSLALGAASCGGETEPPVASEPDAPAGVIVENAWLSLPAVGGNPGAVYFTIRNEGDTQVTIRAADVLGAESATLHETATWNRQADMQELFQLPVPAGGEVTFAPGGKHVMAMMLDDSLVAGGETEVTLTFVGGDKISFPAAIRAPGEDGGAGAS